MTSDPYPGWQSTGLLLGSSLFLLAMLIQLIVLKRLNPQKTSGDETEYINPYFPSGVDFRCSEMWFLL